MNRNDAEAASERADERVFERKPVPDLIRDQYRFA